MADLETKLKTFVAWLEVLEEESPYVKTSLIKDNLLTLLKPIEDEVEKYRCCPVCRATIETHSIGLIRCSDPDCRHGGHAGYWPDVWKKIFEEENA